MSGGFRIKLSQRSQELIKNYLHLRGANIKDLPVFSESVDVLQILQWLDEETPSSSQTITEEMEFLLASLRAQLLSDLVHSLPQCSPPNQQEENTSNNKIKFILLAMAGTLLAACEGFDSITTLIGVLSVPSAAILIAGLLFSILSVIVFYGFDLVQVSQNLGIKLTDSPKLLDVYLQQMNEIKAVRRIISKFKLASLSLTELEYWNSTVAMLQKRFAAVIETSKQFDAALNRSTMRIAKEVFSALAGLLFFGGGFFAGQSVAVFILGLFITTITPAFWPVVLFSAVVGVAAFSLYWYIERVGVKRLISGWFGLDEEKIDKLCDMDTLKKEEDKLVTLKEQINSTLQLKSQRTPVLEEAGNCDGEILRSHEFPAVLSNSQKPNPTSRNIYSFHFTSANENSLRAEESEHYAIASECSNN